MSASPKIFHYDTLGSTNDEAARLLAADSPAPLVVIARRQTKGRGRFGRPWLSEPNGNLYISFGFRPRVAPARLQTFTLWMGVILCDFLAATLECGGRALRDSAERRHRFGRFTPAVSSAPLKAVSPVADAPSATALQKSASLPGIKWPNDIFFGARKVAGLLTEARVAAGDIDTLVFGLGLNLKPPAAGWPPELAATATSLAEQSGGELAGVDINAFTAALITRVLDAHTQLLENPDATAVTLAALWQKYDYLRGKTITALSGNGNDRITGIADGIDAEGSLILKLPDARIEKIRAGEVTIEKKLRPVLDTGRAR